jgi:hypothetical protein
LVRIEFEQDQIAGKANAWEDACRSLIDEYRGTQAALLAEVGVVDNEFDLQRRIAALDAFWRGHPGSEAGAKALFQKGYQLANNAGMSGTEPRGVDPAARFLQVVGIVG